MKIGDRVKIVDGSYAKKIRTDGSIKDCFCSLTSQEQEWFVLAMNCKDLPTDKPSCPYYTSESKKNNDCVVISTDFTKVVFTRRSFIKLCQPTKVCIEVDGKKTYISRESAIALNLI